MNLKYIIKLRYVLAFFGVFLFIITIYGLEFFESIMGFLRRISLYWENIAFFIIGLCIIALFVNMTEHYILRLGGYIEPPDNIRASESLSKKLIKLFKREKWTVIYSFLLLLLIYIFSHVLPQYVLYFYTTYFLVVIIIPFILLSHRLRETHPKMVKYIGSLPSILSICFLLLIWYYLWKSDVLLYTCYISGILISIAYYWHRIPYVLRKVNKYLKIIINESYNLMYPENRNSTLIKQVLKERAIEYCNHKKDESIILTEETDCFGTLKKVNTIEELTNSEIFNNYKTIALYGNWGSGKSSVIETLIDRYGNNRETICIKFNAWKYENEENLPYALLEHIIAELGKNEDIKFEIKMIKDSLLKSGKIVFKSFGVNYGIFNLSFEKIESEKYGKIETLIEKFEELSYILLENNKKLIVFIDELDRCERENILKFLASLKLFFTSGDNINYICAVDKEAIEKALKHKYGDEEKAEEYLEKIFNFSFNMPETFDVEKFIMQYGFFNDNEIAEKLAKFFEAINFTTPRRLKKVLNKYEYLFKIKNSYDISEDLKNLIPDIICIDLKRMPSTSKYYLKKYSNQNYIENIIKRLKNGNKDYLFDTIFVLYFIILYEFYPEKYLEVKRYEYRVEDLKCATNTMTKASKDKYASISKVFRYYIDKYGNSLINAPLFKLIYCDSLNNCFEKNYFIKYIFKFEDMMKILEFRGNLTNYKLKDKYAEYVKNIPEFEECFDEFIDDISVFLSCVGDENIDKDETKFAERREKAGITVDFWEYIKNNYEDLIEEDYSNDYPFTKLFKMVETLL